MRDNEYNFLGTFLVDKPGKQDPKKDFVGQLTREAGSTAEDIGDDFGDNDP